MGKKDFILNTSAHQEWVCCAICGEDSYRLVFSNAKDKFMQRLSIPGKSSLVMCSGCGLVYHNPRIREDAMQELYRTYEYPTRNVDVQKARRKDAKERFDWLSQIHEEVKSVLEIGCAEGFILQLFKSAGKEVKGVDPSDKYAKAGRDNAIPIETAFFDKDFSLGSFDLIISCNTFEHMYHPLDILSEIKKRTKKYLFLECPNVFMPRDNLKYNYFNTTHVYMYSLNTMKQMLALAGFDVVRMDDSGFGIRVLAIKKDEPLKLNLSKDGYRQLRKKIFLHQLKWSLTAQWKDWLRSKLKF